MIPIDQLARIAYEKHAAAVIARPPIVPWASIDIKTKAAWIAVVQAVRTEIERH